MTHADVAKTIADLKDKNIVLLYAFNSSGKTRLCVEYKNFTKDPRTGDHAGIYYNAYSEDLFQWDNDEENDNANIRLKVVPSSLNDFHSLLLDKPENIADKLAIYQPGYKFELVPYADRERGIEAVVFTTNDDTGTQIKISRGEERTFVWCFFLALFEVEDWSKKQNAHIYIDDPVSSLDDHNLFITAQAIHDLILSNYKSKKVIISTHHIGLFSVLATWLAQLNDKKKKDSGPLAAYVLSNQKGVLNLSSTTDEVFLYHLHLLKTLQKASEEKEVYRYHVVLLRQVLENVASFLGRSKWGSVLSDIKVPNPDEVANVINSLSHQSAFRLQYNKLSGAEEGDFTLVLKNLVDHYQFKLN
ncbi:MAG: AAA family ATPase [Bacteroidetes bacterium]|nr:AAA family ATPase [Bacteroidota bacterium]